MKPKKTRIRKLVAALRSGKYKQARHALRDLKGGKAMCCLGVACEIFRKETGRGKWDDCHFMDSSGSMPQAVADWYGFKEQNPIVEKRTTLAEINDKDDSSFEEIASIIEKEWLT